MRLVGHAAAQGAFAGSSRRRPIFSYAAYGHTDDRVSTLSMSLFEIDGQAHRTTLGHEDPKKD
jgi:hypothetical protein